MPGARSWALLYHLRGQDLDPLPPPPAPVRRRTPLLACPRRPIRPRPRRARRRAPRRRRPCGWGAQPARGQRSGRRPTSDGKKSGGPVGKLILPRAFSRPSRSKNPALLPATRDHRGARGFVGNAGSGSGNADHGGPLALGSSRPLASDAATWVSCRLRTRRTRSRCTVGRPETSPSPPATARREIPSGRVTMLRGRR